MTIKNFLKRSAGWATASKDKFRHDLYVRTAVLIIATQAAFSVAVLGAAWFAVHYIHGDAGEGVRAMLRHLLTERAWPMLALLSGLSLAAGALVARYALRPARESLKNQKRFIGDIAHELRTPLSIIKTNAEVALLDPALDGAARDTLTSSIEELDRASAIINNLLTFSAYFRPERVSLREVGFSEVVENVVESYRPLAESRDIVLLQDIADATVWGNENALEQMASNIIRNALHYTPEHSGGRVEVSLRPGEEGGTFFSVTDNGIGIPKADLYHIFEPFFKSDRSRARGLGGTSGLGLTIVHEVVRVHRGSITIHSAPGKGTKVAVFLPEKNMSSEQYPKAKFFESRHGRGEGGRWSEIVHDFSFSGFREAIRSDER